MVKEIKYGVISDIHEDPNIIVPTVQTLRKEGVNRFLINGDIGGHYGSLDQSMQFTSIILNEVAKQGLETYVQPGSHEPFDVFGPVVDDFENKFSHVYNTVNLPKVELEGHDLIFIPGSDFTAGGEYKIGNDNKMQTGNYVQTKEGPIPFQGQQGTQQLFRYTNLNDLKSLVTNPDKTIVVCHVPRKFNNLETAVDMAEFGEVTEDFELNGDLVKKGNVYPLLIANKIADAGYPIEIKKENRGNEAMKKLYEELGINKAVSGHFHESSHRANDRFGNHVEEGKKVNELFWNSGHLDRGNTGILTVKGDEVSYRNIKI